jgi:hypothetical protein
MPRDRPPAWFIGVTALFTLAILVMAVAETSVWTHYLIDQGEMLCLGGLAFALACGLHLHRSGRLARSLPLFAPWLLYPVVTQGDQIIDNLSIGGMRFFAHAVLLVLFLAPLGVAAAGARFSRRPPWVAALLLLEIGVAYRYLGTIMVGLLTAVLLSYLAWVLFRRRAGDRSFLRFEAPAALFLLLGGVVLSLALYLGYKHRPGAYQGSPHHFHDPSRRDGGYSLDTIAVPPGEPAPLPGEALSQTREALAAYASALEELLEAYYVLDRNYNYAFHNALFLRSTPVVPGFRGKALEAIAKAKAKAADASQEAFDCGQPVAAFLEDVKRFTEFQFERARILEAMSGDFEKTEAGLQHATHLYEGEGKYLGIQLRELLRKHQALLAREDLREVVAPFVQAAARIESRYASRIVGF